MSIFARNWAAVCSPTKGGSRFVLDQLADHADENHVAWPSQATLAELTGYTERGVRGILAALVEEGVIVPEANYVRQLRRPGAHTVAYRLVVTLCRHGGEPDPSSSWASRCTHKGGNKVPPRRRRGGGQGAERSAGAGAAPGAGIDRNDVPAPRNDVPQRGERRADEPPEEPPLNDGAPSSTVSPDARATPLATPTDGIAHCPDCRSDHAPGTPHPRGVPRPADWHERTRTVSDDVEIEDPPEGWEDEPLWTEGAHQMHPPAEHEETSA